MEEVVGSDRKNKKKEENPSSDKVFQRKKKRPSIVLSDSEFSEDSLEQNNEKVFVQTSWLSNGESESERKRRLDVFDFDEYDNIDEKRLKRERDFEHDSNRRVSVEKKKFNKMGKKELAGCSVKSKLKIEENDNFHERRMKKDRDFKPECSKEAAIEKRKQFALVKKESVDYSVKKKLKTEGDEDGDLPLSSLKQKLNSPLKESVKSQGKNGDLKVMVIKKKIEVPKKSVDVKLDIDDKKLSKFEEITKKKKSVSFSPESKVMREKREVKKEKPANMEAPSPSRGVKRERDQSPKKVTPVKGSASKIKRGSSTEKQKLREKLKSILLDAGWKIDYRPRKSRDYLDAVYISPKGRAYWSIVKAYDAFQKHMDEDVKMEPSSFSEDITLLTRTTQRKIEREMKMKRKENNRKGRFTEESGEDSDSDNKDADDKPKKAKKITKDSDDRKSHKLGRGTLLVRSSEKGLNSENEGYIAYTGKRTLFSWLIDSGIVNLSEKVKYMNKKQTKVMLEGCVKRGGIHCSCCSKVVSVLKFEIHAGSKLRRPYQNIFLDNSGVSLLQCQVEAWNKQEGSYHSGFHSVDIDGDDPNDDTCSLCGDGGDLICCDSCPSTFHQSCLDVGILPDGDWHCPNCTCKFCGIGGADSSVDENDTAANVMLTCGLCEKKYHESCCEKVDNSSGSSPYPASFCGPKCYKIFDHLKNILGVKHKLDDGFSWSLIHRSDIDTDESHRSYPQRVVSNSKLAVALSVMDECFLPIVDRRSEINLVNSILYNCGSNFSRLDFSGFYTVILERGVEIVAAASIRFRGTQLAEMPFIGTRHMYRRQGMCRRLLGAIESILSSVNVKKLTIPAIAEHMHTWTAIFGFKPFDVSHKQELRSMNMVVFPGIDMLEKFIVEKESSEVDLTANSGNNMKEIINEGEDPVSPPENFSGGLDVGPPTDSAQLDMNGLVRKANDVDETVTDHDNNKGDVTLHNADEANDESNVVEPSLAVPLNGNNSKEMISGGEGPVSPLSPNCSEGVDVGPTTDSAQLDMSGLVQKDVKFDETETVKVCDLVVGADSKADQANDSVETVPEIASKADPSKNNVEIASKADPANNSVEIVSVIASKADSANDSEETVSDIASEADPSNNSIETCSESASKADPVSNSDKTVPGITSKADPTNNSVNTVSEIASKADPSSNSDKTVPGIASKADPSSNSDKTVPGIASKADPAIIDEAVSETASDKPVASPVNVCDPTNIEEEEDNVNVVDILTQNSTLEDKECVNGDVDDDHKDNSEIASVEPGLDCNTERPSQNEVINEDKNSFSVLKLKEEAISKLKPDSENDMAKNVDEPNAPMGIDLNSTSTEGGTVEEVQENSTN